ncbi:transcription termination factor Rho [SAR202 cluster bacterium AD-804-J14_MRT_500m]|nr:transcription termination factor Rho [SAR202 cluster bacterium AD-804-J14_MRT_500m]
MGLKVTTQQILDVSELQKKTKEELLTIAESMDIENGAGLISLRKEDMIVRIAHNHPDPYSLRGSGTLDMMNDGYGFLRQNGFRTGPGDIYVSQSQIRRFVLRNGDTIGGNVRPPKGGERYFGLVKVDSVNGMDPADARGRPIFEDLTPIFPERQLVLETVPANLITRTIDLFSPIGRGQRGLIVAPPKAGKTTILKDIAKGVTANNPDVHIMVVLIGERPEEVTDIQRSIQGEVFASTFDESVEDQCRMADLALERAKRLVESNMDVLILMDSITRATRAYNLVLPSSGRTLSGGIDPVAVYPPKKFFGAARNVEGGGSLTIIANCLVDTGSRMDEVIYEEFKGTGNMELHLDRRLAERRIFPAVDIARSSTRREELFFDEATLKQLWLLRRMVGLLGNDTVEVTEKILDRLSRTKNNADFLTNLSQPE